VGEVAGGKIRLAVGILHMTASFEWAIKSGTFLLSVQFVRCSLIF